MAPSQKKVIVRLTSAERVAGYLPPRGFVSRDAVELINLEGNVKQFALKDIQLIAYVTDFNLTAASEPEQFGRPAFLAKPRGAGLWVRVNFRDETFLEGLAAPDLHFAEELATDQGVFLTPPDPKSNAHRVYIPCVSMAAFEIIAVIGKGTGAKPKTPTGPARPQPRLFDEE